MSRALRLPAWLAPPQAEVAIEIASGRVTVSRLGRDGQFLGASAVSESLPPGAVTPSLAAKNIEQPQVVIAAVKKALERAGFGQPKRVALVLPDSAARVSLIALEVVPARPADLDQLIRWHVKKATPFPIEDGVLSFVAGTPDNGGSTTFTAVAASRAVVMEYETIADAIGADPGLVDVASLTVINSVVAAGAAPQGDWLLVCLASDSTTIAILRGSALLFHRHRATVEDEPLSALVHQTAMYYEDRLGGSQFQRVILSGGVSDTTRELAKREIGDRLQTPVHTLESLLRERGAA
jgi:Tfp pilus assembly PilM family ATPase